MTVRVTVMHERQRVEGGVYSYKQRLRAWMQVRVCATTQNMHSGACREIELFDHTKSFQTAALIHLAPAEVRAHVKAGSFHTAFFHFGCTIARHGALGSSLVQPASSEQWCFSIVSGL